MTKVTRKYAHRKHGEIGEVEFEWPKGTFRLDGKDLPEASVRHLMTFALQTLQDAYAGADNGEEAKGLWNGKLDKLIAGTIGTRGTGSGRTAVESEMISLARKQAKASDEKKYQNLDNAARTAFVWEYIEGLEAKQRDAYRDMAEKTLEQKAKLAEAKAKLAAEFAIDI